MTDLTLPVYLDYNATTPIHPEVAAVMRPFLDDYFGNPSSSHDYGVAVRATVDLARQQIAQMLGCSTNEIVFTSGGTESDNYALKGFARANREQGNHIITSVIEHPAILNVCRHLETQGYAVTYVPVDEHGMVHPEEVERSLRDETILISIMHANNEVGTIQPINEISALAHSRRIAMHTDAAQSVGKVPCRVDDLGVDMLTIAGHKLYAPKGVGALYLRDGIKLEPLLHGAGHEQGRRASTENVMEIAGLGKACELIEQTGPAKHKHLSSLRDSLYNQLMAKVPNLRLNGHPDLRLPNTLSISFAGINATELLTELHDKVAVSAGAACHASSVTISHVLEAMQVPAEWAMGTIRFSVGSPTTQAEIDSAVDLIAAAVQRLRSQD